MGRSKRRAVAWGGPQLLLAWLLAAGCGGSRDNIGGTPPSDCQNSAMYPGSINIWVNGIAWDQAQHGQTGCMSQYEVIPTAKDSPLNIGTMAGDTWFQGAIGKVAVYDELLTQAQIDAHYQAMTGLSPVGSCSDTCSF